MSKEINKEALMADYAKHVNEIACHLKKHGFEVQLYDYKYRDADVQFKVNGKMISTHMRIDNYKTVSTWRGESHEHAVWIKVRYVKTQCFPRKKDGTFSYAKIAQTIMEFYDEEVTNHAIREAKDERLEKFNKLIGELNLQEKHLKTLCENYNLTITNLTEEQVKKVVALLRNEGIQI